MTLRRAPQNRLGSARARLPGLLALAAVSGVLHATEPAPDTAADLAKKSENPLARVYNIGLTGNFNFEKGPDERTQAAYTLTANVPIDLPRDWNLFLNAQLPVISQPIGATDRTVGMGDMTLTCLLSPPSSRRWVYGFGPSIVVPTATDASLGQSNWELGPALAVAHTRRTLLAGLLVYQNWSVIGAASEQGVSRLTVLPFITWYINKGWYLLSAPAISADWEQEPGRVWTVPVGGGFGHIVRRGKHAFNFTAHAYINVVRPDDAAKWQFRLTTSWVFPKGWVPGAGPKK